VLPADAQGWRAITIDEDLAGRYRDARARPGTRGLQQPGRGHLRSQESIVTTGLVLGKSLYGVNFGSSGNAGDHDTKQFFWKVPH
jgi:hypothetical protein